MQLQIFSITFIIFQHVTGCQPWPVSPCPNIFNYRFDGSEWYGILSVLSPEISQPLHLHVELSMGGIHTTSYWGEIQLLTRGEYTVNTPVFYKIKFPVLASYVFPPKVVQIVRNNQIICVGPPDQSFFVTQILMDHTRNYTFIPAPSSSLPSSFLSPATDAMSLAGGHLPDMPSRGMNKFSVTATYGVFNTQYLPSNKSELIPRRPPEDICGTIDDHIRFHVVRKAREASIEYISNTTFANEDDHIDSIWLKALLKRRRNKISVRSKTTVTDKTNTEGDNLDGGGVDISYPAVITSDTYFDSEPTSNDGSISIGELQSIPRGAWPWLAAIYVNNLTSLTYRCAGTLVTSRIVISSAHCFHLFKQRYKTSEVLVFLGRHNLRTWDEEDSLAAPVDDIYIYPEYNPHLNSYDGDIAVLVLKNEVRFNTYIRPACLWSGPTAKQYIEGEDGFVVGWGIGGFNITKQFTTTPVPKIINTPIVSNDVCFKANSKYKSLSSNRTFCAGVMPIDNKATKTTKRRFTGKSLNPRQQQYLGPCAGDSGSGLMIFKNNRWMLRGTVSGALPMKTSTDIPSTTSKFLRKCNMNQYVIYTDVAEFLDWIFAFII